MKVCKFGGTSMADAQAIEQSAKIIESDPTRRFVVVSAPGKRYAGDTKITDLFYRAHAEANQAVGSEPAMDIIEQRFNEIVEGLGLELDLRPYFDRIRQDLAAGANKDYAASRGEYLSAVIMSKRLGFQFVDAVEIIKFFEDGTLDSEYTNDLTAQLMSELDGAVVPGFYGLIEGCRIKTFSRGGSDITGAILARAVGAVVYENWTDVNGFLVCDPRIVPQSELIDVMTYKELRELSYMGAGVLHHDAIFPVRSSDIPINIRNTFSPDLPGTMIIPTSQRRPLKRVVTGIAGKKNFLAINIEKSMMNAEVGFLRKALTVLEHYDVSIEHVPTGIDTITFILDKTEVDGVLDRIISELRQMLCTDLITVVDGLSLIATVGHGMSNRKGTAAKLFDALSKADVNVKMIDQGSSELNIIVAVDNSDFEKAINAIYNAFCKKH